MQKARRHPDEPDSDTLYATGFRYYFTPLAGVLFTFPSRYLFTIGCQGVFSLIRWSGRIHAEFHVFRITWDTPESTPASRTRLSRSLVVLSRTLRSPSWYPWRGPATPEKQVSPVWALPLSLATTYGIISFSFPGATEMFHFTPYRFYRLCIHLQMTVFKGQPGCPIRKPTGQSLLVANRGLSQLATSFIASWHLGIHQLHLVA